MNPSLGFAMLAAGKNDRRTASLPFSAGTSLLGRFAVVGGTLTLTAGSVIFTPLFRLGRTRRFSLRDIDSVAAFADRTPRLKITLRTGRPLVLMVLPNLLTPIFTPDSSVRDEAIASINQRLRTI
ncbi:hypothetical protein [Saccharopolyspora shandongensis]|uniref:hypothetical protein n=1 Tax=Saccharopolyspora shandongensis TaxID=418495 RepID=UPI0033F971F8